MKNYILKARGRIEISLQTSRINKEYIILLKCFALMHLTSYNKYTYFDIKMSCAKQEKFP